MLTAQGKYAALFEGKKEGPSPLTLFVSTTPRGKKRKKKGEGGEGGGRGSSGRSDRRGSPVYIN